MTSRALKSVVNESVKICSKALCIEPPIEKDAKLGNLALLVH